MARSSVLPKAKSPPAQQKSKAADEAKAGQGKAVSKVPLVYEAPPPAYVKPRRHKVPQRVTCYLCGREAGVSARVEFLGGRREAVLLRR